MAKPFKDTAVGQFLLTKGVSALGLVGDVLPDSGSLGIVKNIIGKATELTTEDKTKALSLLTQTETEFEAQLKDTESARKMQIAALGQTDVFSKRFVAYFTIFITAFTCLLILGLYFVDIPKDNQNLVYMALGIFLGSGFTSACAFWLGTSNSSKTKDDQINQIMQTKK
jgi:hypothetical protein